MRLDLKALRSFATRALAACEAESSAKPLPAQIEVTLLSDAAITKVHRDFMGIDGPTDVLTFEHGELLIGVPTARRYAAEYGCPLDEELARYIVHGLLHLRGWRDAVPKERAAMHRRQESILRTTF